MRAESTPDPPTPVPGLVDELPPGRPIELPGRGVTFVREAAGPAGAPTLLLLHGLAATGGLNWFTAFPVLTRHFHVLAMDNRGHGRGIRATRFQIADCADDVAALAQVLRLPPFIVAGYSMGGPIAQLLWHRHPDLVAGMVFCATARNFRGTRSRGLMVTALPAAWAARFAPAAISRGAGIIATRGVEDATLRRWAIAELSRSSPRSMLQAVSELGAFTSHEWIEDVDVPVAVVVTMRDQLVPPNRQLKLARAIAGATVHPVQGDHFVCAMSPKLFVPALEEACISVAVRAGLLRG